MSDNNDLNLILEGSIGKKGVVFDNKGFVYNCKIEKVFGDWVQFLDLVKGYTKIMRISDIKEVQFK